EQDIMDGGRYKVKTERGSTSLTICDVVSDDCDKYTIIVRNSLAEHAAFASLAVGSAPEPPAAKPNHSEVTADSITLSWYGPTFDGGSVVTGYTVEARKAGSDDWYTLISGCHSTSYIARGLEKNCQYEFRVRAQNVHGLSEPSKPSTPVTTADPVDKEEEPEPEDHETAFAPLNVEIEPGSLFDKQYSLHEEVGKGRFGIVYRVTEKNSGVRRAAKIIKCIVAKDKEKVREEIDIMNSLRHPKLLQLGAAYERQREMVMVMEYISGGELFERVVADDFALTERDCILFVRQICEGVQYMHKSLIVHLDLKPENILCVRRTSHQIKLIDFGLARRFNPQDPCRVLFGTPEFIAPEIINYEPIGFASDMWSVGVICYVLLSGLSPFMGDTDAETFNNITRAEFDFDDDAFSAITEDAKDFIMSLLIKRKEKRLTAAECFEHPWLAQTEEDMNKVVLSTDKLKKFIIRRKWQKTGNAIRAIGRMANLTNRRSSQPSSPTRLSPLPENHAHTPVSPSSPSPSNSPTIVSKPKGCAPVTRPSTSMVSERSDSGISECSFSIEENNQNQCNTSNQFGITNGRAVTGRNVLKSGKTPPLDWQSSVDSAVCDDDYFSKNSYGSSARKISNESLIQAKTDTLMHAHSRI
ncbi:Myosin light chain kinase, smooth muscle-like 5, partial [Homarus americanus]